MPRAETARDRPSPTLAQRRDRSSTRVLYFAGDHDYFEVRNEFYKSADGVLLVFDVTSKGSFDSLSDWLDEAARFGLSPETATVVVVANKTDQYPREVTEQEVSHDCSL